MQTLTITRIAGDGDGVANDADGKAVYVPFTLPGEAVKMADPPEVMVASPDRIGPACQHFGVCGGCALQHWGAAPYGVWKMALLGDALRRAGYDGVELAPLVRTPVAARRRVDLAIYRHGAALTIGLHGRASASVIDLAECPILHPALEQLLPPLRLLLRSLSALRREGSAVLNLLDTGPDVLLRLDAAATTPDRTRMAEFARVHGIPRIAIAQGKASPEIAVMLDKPRIEFDGGMVTPAPGAFLQASREGEAAIRAAVVAGLPGKLTSKSRIAELYAGNGTLTFSLARHARIEAFEGDPAAVAALEEGLRAAGIAGRNSVAVRDLIRQPLTVKELSRFAAVVLDPPFAGAGPQMETLAASGVARIVYVSCSPAVLAREARVLREAGYRVLTATPVDQFLWSSRLESVVVFGRK